MQHWKRILLLIISFQFINCKKTKVVVPTACLKSDKTEINKKDSITFTNCSTGANYVYLAFFKKGKEYTGSGTAYTFDSNNQLTKYFFDPDTLTAVLTAQGEERAPFDTAHVSFIVR